MYNICIVWSDLLFYTKIIWNNFRVSKATIYNCRSNLIASNCIYSLYPNNIKCFSLVTPESQKSSHSLLMNSPLGTFLGRCDSEYHECKYSNSTDIECCEINQDCLCDEQCLYTPIQTPPHHICSHLPPTGGRKMQFGV